MRRKEISHRRATRRIAIAAAGAAAVLGAVAGSHAQQAQDYVPQATIVEVMNSMIMPFAEVVWNAVVYEDTIKGPATDEGWQQARNAAVALAESANVLMIPNRPVAPPDKVAGEGELSPQEIGELIATSRGAWVGYARSMHEVAMQIIQAIDTHDAEKLADLGGTMDAVCQACHKQFWYPNQ
jgi:cytochrome c556